MVKVVISPNNNSFKPSLHKSFMQDCSWDCFWKEFILDEPNPAKGSILYCLRYSKGRLEAHRDQVIEGLNRLNEHCTEKRGFFRTLIKFRKNSKKLKSAVESYPILLEELSTINKALKYNSLGFGNYKTLREFKEGIFSLYGKESKLDQAISEAVVELKISQEQGKDFRAHERRDITEMDRFINKV
jgi:hypothetical protein